MSAAWPPSKARSSAFGLLAMALMTVAMALPAQTMAEQASQPSSFIAGHLDVSSGADDTSGHTCARLGEGTLRCWGFGGNGRLGYGSTSTIGDDETPGSAGPVDLGAGRTAERIAAGAFHTCAMLDGGSLRCWGFGGNGRLGYANTNDIGDDETPASVGPVDLGAETATALSAGGAHTCVLLTVGSVRCWGFGGNGRLGYASRSNIGDNETPGSVGPVHLGAGRTARAISAGNAHTCAVLDDGAVRCWGYARDGRLGYLDTNNDVGDNETPASVGPVNLGTNRSAEAISAGNAHTCALLDDGSVRCWGFGGNGRLGYGDTSTIGDDEIPGSVGPVDLGTDRSAEAITAGDDHTCALLDDGSVRCWGFGGNGRLGYGNTGDVGDDETPGSVAPVDLGSDRGAVAISAGGRHTCALLDDGSIRCWGGAAEGRLGYCNANDVGDDETPGSVGPVNFTGSAGCATNVSSPGPDPGAQAPSAARPLGGSRAVRYRRALAAQARRERQLRGCYGKVGRHARREQRLVRRSAPSRRRARAARHIKRHERRGRWACRARHGRTPGRVTDLRARAVSPSSIALSFRAPGTAGSRAPAAREYVVKQSRRPIRGRRGFRGAETLCGGRCRSNVRFVGATVKLTVTDLHPRTAYYYSVAARDNVSGRLGPRSKTAKART